MDDKNLYIVAGCSTVNRPTGGLLQSWRTNNLSSLGILLSFSASRKIKFGFVFNFNGKFSKAYLKTKKIRSED